MKGTGYGDITGPGKTEEFDTCTCKHCGGVWVIKSTEKGQADPGGWCRLCTVPICPKCADKPCLPMEKRLQTYEDKQRFAKDAGLVLR